MIAIAHNSAFDRKFTERYWPVFEGMAWGCSATEVDWRKHGFAGAQLGYLLNGAGYFHQAHRAVDDCHALLEILDFTLPTTGAPALALLLETARKPTVRLGNAAGTAGVTARMGAPSHGTSMFASPPSTTRSAFLKAEIYQRDISPTMQTLTAFTRFSSRI